MGDVQSHRACSRELCILESKDSLEERISIPRLKIRERDIERSFIHTS